MSKISNPNINVICRFRPMNQLEKTNGNEMVADFTSEKTLTFKSTRENNKYKFAFDRVFPPTTTQEEIYNSVVREIIDSVIDGYNGTILAYGQTSSGKTHTMQGDIRDPVNRGIIPRMVDHIFEYIEGCGDEFEFSVKASMIEIYQEKIRDLIDISRTDLSVKEDKKNGIYVHNVSEKYAGGPADVLEIMKLGSDNRAQAATNMNEHSSRSHSIFILTFNSNNKKEGVAKTGKLYLVDLAGSEKIAKTGATGTTLEEAKIINKSLTTLGMVINALTDGKSIHIPYRDSKLTRVLQESLGGNSKTCLIITCSPSVYNESETLSTLRFGERAKKIKNKPKVNKEYTVEELQRVIDDLTLKLEKANERIRQLENFIRNNGLKVPSIYSTSKATESKKGFKFTIEEQKELNELKQQYDGEQIEIEDRIKKIIQTVEDGYDESSIKDLFAMLLSAQEKIKEREIDYQQKKENLEKLQEKAINDNTAEAISQGDPAFKAISSMKLNVNTFLNKLQNEAKLNKNTNMIDLISDFQQKFSEENKYDSSKEENENNLASNEEFEKMKIELEEINKKYINEINIYKETMDQKIIELSESKSKYEELKFDFETYKEASKLPNDAHQNQKNLAMLKNRIQELSQEKGNLEYSLRQQMSEIKNLKSAIEEYKNTIEDYNKNNNLRVSIALPHLVKKIQGGQQNDPLRGSAFGKSVLGNSVK